MSERAQDWIDQFIDWFTDVDVPVDVLPVTVAKLKERARDPFWKKLLAERIRLA